MLITKSRKIEELHPPREIREITKTRRAWLATTAAEVNATAGRSAKIVGAGSYQYVAVYAVEQVEVQTQTRGTCQFCAGVQAIKDGRVALHGYTRPGWGWIAGRCVGSGRAPAEVSISDAEILPPHHRDIAAQREARADEIERVEIPALKAAVRAVDYPTNRPSTAAERTAWRTAYDAQEKREADVRKIRHEARAHRDYAQHIEKFVLPRFGQPLYQVAK